MPTPNLAPHVDDELRRLAAAQLRDQPPAAGLRAGVVFRSGA